jgi:hypothetical protein
VEPIWFSKERRILIQGNDVWICCFSSEQSLIDCDIKSDKGCDGGLPIKAYDYIIDKGLAESSSYPYAAKSQRCKTYQPQMPITNACSYDDATDDVMKFILLKFGPIAVGISK